MPTKNPPREEAEAEPESTDRDRDEEDRYPFDDGDFETFELIVEEINLDDVPAMDGPEVCES